MINPEEDRDPFEQLSRQETEQQLWESLSEDERKEYEEWSDKLDRKRNSRNAEGGENGCQDK